MPSSFEDESNNLMFKTIGIAFFILNVSLSNGAWAKSVTKSAKKQSVGELQTMLSTTKTEKSAPLVKLIKYAVYDPKHDKQAPLVLRSNAAPISFPLNQDDQETIEIISKKFDSEENCAGLAAPQLGISKRAIVFALPEDFLEIVQSRGYSDKKAIPKTIWINPSFKGIGAKDMEGIEGCFSVKGYIGYVKRYRKVSYTAYTPDGKKVEGIAEGYFAKIVQHEIDHTNGILFTDVADKIITIEQFEAELKERQAKMKAEEK